MPNEIGGGRSVGAQYTDKYFKETAENVGLILKSRRPLWRRWVKVIRKYKASGKLLDVGCGPGFFLAYAGNYYDIYGVDISEYAIREAKKRVPAAKLQIGSATHLYYKRDYFDVVTCFDLLEHLPDPELAVEEFNRVLSDKGVLIIRVPNINSLGAKRRKAAWFGYRDRTHVSLWSNEEWIGLLKKSGFDIIEVFFDGLWDTPYFKLLPKLLQDVFIKLPSLVLFLCGMKFSQKNGENLCIIGKQIGT